MTTNEASPLGSACNDLLGSTAMKATSMDDKKYPDGLADLLDLIMDPTMGAGIELVKRLEPVFLDAERYRWLKSRQGLTLRNESPSVWKRPDGTTYCPTHSVSEGGVHHAPAESLDAAIDAAMQAARIRAA